MSFTKICVAVTCAIATSAGHAQIKDGKYDGTLQCSALLTNPNRGPWTQPVQLRVTGNSMSWLREDGQFIESGTGTLQSGRVSLTLDGAWNIGSKSTGNWRTVAMLNLEGAKLWGPATIFSGDGGLRLRDCTVEVTVSVGSVGISPPAALLPLLKDGSEKGQSARQAVSQVANAVKQNAGAAIGSMANQAGQSTAVLPATGKLFSTKAELIQRSRSGQFLTLSKSTGDEMTTFADSIRTVLNNDYGVTGWPMERAMQDGVSVMRLDTICQSEFNSYVEQLFRGIVQAHMSTLPANPFEFSGRDAGRDIGGQRKTVDASVTQLQNLKNGWCSKNSTHPYQFALPKLFAEFEVAIAAATNDRRAQLLAEQQKKKLTEESIARAQTNAAIVESQKRAEAVQQQKDQEALLARQQADHEKGASARNAQKIKAIGLPSDFLASTLYTNYMGQWSPLMSCAQWVGLLLENKKIASVEAISVGGRPGISVKRTGQPAVGIVFRMEGKEAYVFALVIDGRVELARSPADHSQLALQLKVLTSEKYLN